MNSRVPFCYGKRISKRRFDKLKQVFFDPQLSREQFISQLSMVITEREAFMSDELIRLDANNAKHYVQLLINLRATITAKQLKHANAEFADMLKDIEQLIAND